MTETQKAAMQQALEFCEELQGGCTDSDDGTVEAITVWCPEVIAALRAALAEPEPVADEMKAQALDALNRMQSIMMMNDGRHPRNVLRAFVQLASAPPARQPLTETEMYAVEDEARKNFMLSQRGPRGQQIVYWDALTPWLIRATERAHKIGGNDE